MKIPLDAIRIDLGTQQRTSINEVAVSDYAEIYMAGKTLPDPVVFFDGVDYMLADGFHRYHAARRAALFDIVVDLRQGTRREAVLFSVAANATHGLRRSADDKRKAVRTMLEDEEWGRWADREIARHCSVSPNFVGKLREEMKPAEPSVLEDRCKSEPETRTVRRGEQVYQQKVEKAGKAPAAAPAPAAKAKPAKTSKAAEPDAEAEERLATALEVAQEAQQQCEELTAMVKALEADDQKAETAKYVRMYEHAKREQSAAMDRAAAAQEREAWTKRQLMRCGKALGEADPTKIAARVEAFVREHQPAAKPGKVAA